MQVALDGIFTPNPRVWLQSLGSFAIFICFLDITWWFLFWSPNQAESQICYRYRCGIMARFHLRMEVESSQASIFEKRSLIFSPTIKDMVYLPFSLWHLMEIWPLEKIVEWGAAEDRKTRVGWRRNNCGLSSIQLSHIDDNALYTMNDSVSSSSSADLLYPCSTQGLEPQLWEFDPHSDCSGHPNAFKIKFSSLSPNLFPEHTELSFLITSKAFNIQVLNFLHFTFDKHLIQWCSVTE